MQDDAQAFAPAIRKEEGDAVSRAFQGHPFCAMKDSRFSEPAPKGQDPFRNKEEMTMSSRLTAAVTGWEQH